MYGEMGVRLIEKGWKAPIPLRPGEKRPALNGWERFNDEPVPEARARAWASRFPGHGVGLAAGHDLLAIDLDTDTEAEARLSDDLADDLLGKTSMIRIGREHRTMRHYRLDRCAVGSVATVSFHRFGIYATTGQTVLFGIHPDTGRPYSWPQSSPLDEGPGTLPKVTLRGLSTFVWQMRRAFPEPVERHHREFDHTDRRRVGGGGPATIIYRKIANEPDRTPFEIALDEVRNARVGRRHRTMVGAAVALVQLGFRDDEIFGPVLEAHLSALSGDRPDHLVAAVVADALDWARQRIGRPISELDVGLRVDDWSIWR